MTGEDGLIQAVMSSRPLLLLRRFIVENYVAAVRWASVIKIGDVPSSFPVVESGFCFDWWLDRR